MTMYYRIQPSPLLSAYELHSALRKIDIKWAALQYIPQQVKSSVEEESVRHKILRIVNSHKNDVGGILKKFQLFGLFMKSFSNFFGRYIVRQYR